MTARLRRLSPRRDGTMAITFENATAPHDARALQILAKSIYRELRTSGYQTRDVMALTSELLGLVATEVKNPAADPAAE